MADWFCKCLAIGWLFGISLKHIIKHTCSLVGFALLVLAKKVTFRFLLKNQDIDC